MEVKDTYKTISDPTEKVLYKEKNSKFFGYCFPVKNEAEAKIQLDALKKLHHSARHWCYAYQIGTDSIKYRVNDDGEPSNSAGQPIYGQIQSFGVTNILIVVVRYFGGVKLGVGGLINAYKSVSQLALEKANIVTKTINLNYLITFDYKNMNKVMRIIKEKQLNIVKQVLELDCNIEISVRKNDSQAIFNLFHQLYEIKIKKIID